MTFPIIADSGNGADNNGRVDGLIIIRNTLKVFNNTDPIEIVELVRLLRESDPTYNISKGPGRNIIEDEYENTVINFLIEKDWNAFKYNRGGIFFVKLIGKELISKVRVCP